MRKRLFIIAGLLAVIFLSALLWYQSGLSAVTDEETETSVTIAEGSSVKKIAEQLKDAGVIRNVLAFRLYVKLRGEQSNLKAGTYVLSPNLNVREIVIRLSDGDVLPDEVLVLIPEGYTSTQIASRLAETFAKVQEVTEDELRTHFLAAFANTDRPYDFLTGLSSNATLEGFLFPDTYRFFKDATPEEVTVKLLDNFAQKVPETLRAEADTRGYAFYEVLILASIVERELQNTEDRKLAADLFFRRLEIGQALQSDATVNYVTGDNDLRPSSDDISVDSPYNTYKYPGLPPGPIANPGLDAINATLHPTPNEFYYFLTDADNVAHFARTFAEHSANIQRYLE